MVANIFTSTESDAFDCLMFIGDASLPGGFVESKRHLVRLEEFASWLARLLLSIGLRLRV